MSQIRWRITDIRRGLYLREECRLSYPAIAVVLREYHGLDDATDRKVRDALRRYGARPRPRGESEKNLKRGWTPA